MPTSERSVDGFLVLVVHLGDVCVLFPVVVSRRLHNPNRFCMFSQYRKSHISPPSILVLFPVVTGMISGNERERDEG